MTNNSSSLRSKLHAKKHVLKEKDLASPSTANDKYYFGEPKYAPGEVNFKDPDSDLFRYKQPGFKELVQRIPEPRAIDLEAYNVMTAKKMYGTDLPSPIKLLKAGARV